MSTPAERYVTHWHGPTFPQWVTRLENGQYQSYHYIREAADRNTAHLNELVKLRSENAALRKAALALISELDVEAFDRVGRPKAEMLYEHVGPLRAAVNAARAKEGGST